MSAKKIESAADAIKLTLLALVASPDVWTNLSISGASDDVINRRLETTLADWGIGKTAAHEVDWKIKPNTIILRPLGSGKEVIFKGRLLTTIVRDCFDIGKRPKSGELDASTKWGAE